MDNYSHSKTESSEKIKALRKNYYEKLRIFHNSELPPVKIAFEALEKQIMNHLAKEHKHNRNDEIHKIHKIQGFENFHMYGSNPKLRKSRKNRKNRKNRKTRRLA